MLSREPAVLIACLAALIQALMMFWTKDAAWQAPEWVMPVLTAVAGIVIRWKVFSHHTIREAGFTPSELQARADSPAIQPKLKGQE